MVFKEKWVLIKKCHVMDTKWQLLQERKRSRRQTQLFAFASYKSLFYPLTQPFVILKTIGYEMIFYLQ